MIQVGKLTGRVFEGHLVEVEGYFGVKRLCVPCLPPGYIAIPYQKWVDKYKDKFLGVVDFEEDNIEKPLLIGLKPLKDNQTPTEGLVDNMYMMSEQFRVWLNDATKEMVLDVLDAAGWIKFGDKNATEHAVLGDLLKGHLEDMCDKAQDLATQAGQITVNTAVGPSSPPINLAAFTQLAVDFATIKAALGDILSAKVKLK